MAHHNGRVIDHVHLRVTNVEKSKRFYKAVLKALGLKLKGEGQGFFFADEFYVDKADGYITRVHLAFQAQDREAVRRFHEAGLAAGGRDNGAPGERRYHSAYFATFVLDPDGNNIEAVHHGAAGRATASVGGAPDKA